MLKAVIVVAMFIAVCSGHGSSEEVSQYDAACKTQAAITGTMQAATAAQKTCFKFCVESKSGKIPLNTDNSLNISQMLSKIPTSDPNYTKFQTALTSCQKAGQGQTDFCTAATAIMTCFQTQASNGIDIQRLFGHGPHHRH